MCIYFAEMTLCKLTSTTVLSPQTFLKNLSVICFIGNVALIFKNGYSPPSPPTEIHMIILNDQFTLTRQQRGNLNTRFRKLSEDGSTYAAIILAVSGLERMNWHHLISEVSQPCVCLGDSLFQWFWWQSVSVVLVTVCFSGSGDCFTGSGDSLFHWVWWQSVSLGLVTVWFSVSIMRLKRMSWPLLVWEVLGQHHEVEENVLTSSDLGGSLSASRVWREGADIFWFGRFSVSISSMKRRSWPLLIWEVSCKHHEVEETELILSYLDLFVFLSASWGWRDWADIVIFGFVCFSVSIVRLKRLSWYCHIWICLFFCQHREVEETELILSYLDLFVFLSASWGWRDWADIVIFGFVCFSVSIVRLKRLSWYCLIWICLFFCQHHEVEETELILSDLEGTLSASQVSKNELISSDLGGSLLASWVWREWDGIWHGRSFICVFVSAWWSAIWSVVIYIICISIVFWCQLFQLDYEMNMPRAHLRKGALRPHFCYYYCLRVLGCRKGFDALVFGRCLMYSFSLFVFSFHFSTEDVCCFQSSWHNVMQNCGPF